MNLQSAMRKAVDNCLKAYEKEEHPMEEGVLEKWIWVDGYKGVRKDMSAHGGFVYELGKQYEMPEDTNIELCSSGFHMCLNLNDVFGYYDIGAGNRFFKVKALVREADADGYGRGLMSLYPYALGTDKLVAKSIILTEELTVDEIFEAVRGKYADEIINWSDEHKKLALELGIQKVINLVRIEQLEALGYSSAFAKLICDKTETHYRLAVAAGSQPGLSMDMKVWLIFKDYKDGDA